MLMNLWVFFTTLEEICLPQVPCSYSFLGCDKILWVTHCLCGHSFMAQSCVHSAAITTHWSLRFIYLFYLSVSIFIYALHAQESVKKMCLLAHNSLRTTGYIYRILYWWKFRLKQVPLILPWSKCGSVHCSWHNSLEYFCTLEQEQPLF